MIKSRVLWIIFASRCTYEATGLNRRGKLLTVFIYKELDSALDGEITRTGC